MCHKDATQLDMILAAGAKFTNIQALSGTSVGNSSLHRRSVSDEWSDLVQDLLVQKLYLPNYRYWLCDLSQCSDDEINGEVILRVGLLLLKYIRQDDFPYFRSFDYLLPTRTQISDVDQVRPTILR